MALPVPSADAQAASQALKAHLQNAIQAAQGWLSFADYMQLVLYTPGLGYYSGGSAKLGKSGDFTTAPEISPLFGQTLARVCQQLLQQTPVQLLEFGAGSGRLAFDLLSALHDAGCVPERYAILELSGELRARQQELLAPFSEVVWLDQLPAQFSGVMLANEVLDAMPVALVRKGETGWEEVGVVFEAGVLGWSTRPCTSVLCAQIAQQIPEAETLPEGYVTEVHPAACGFMRALGKLRCEQAGEGLAAILIDYGFPAREYYLPQRDHGTLMCHYRHHAHDDPFFWPGLQDITSHVDFSAMARSAEAGGLEVLSYSSQAAFLIGAGITDLLARFDVTEAKTYLPQTNALNKLLSPAEMGELFKVLVVGQGVSLPQAILRQDRVGRL